MKNADEFIPTRRSLLSRLKNWDDQESWKTFFETYWRLIYNASLRAGLSDAEAQDVVQETVISISKSIRNFKYDPAKGSFKTWLMHNTTWRIISQLRKRMPIQSPQPDDLSPPRAAIDQMPDPALPALEAAWDEEWKEHILETAILRIKAKVDPKLYQAFDLSVRKKWPISKISADLKISAAKVYFARHSIGRLVKKEVACLADKPVW